MKVDNDKVITPSRCSGEVMHTGSVSVMKTSKRWLYSKNILYSLIMLLSALIVYIRNVIDSQLFGMLIYYGYILILAVVVIYLSVRRSHEHRPITVSISAVIIIIMSVMSILCNDIPAYFAPWKRLFMSVMLMCGVGPLITWGKVRRLRVSLLRWLCLGGVIAAFYYAGIYIFMYTHYCSWMSRYAWVFEHAIVISMLVSALSAIGALWVCHIMAGPWQLRRDLLLLPVLGVCVYSLIMTSSRVAAAGFMFALVMLLLHYFYRRSRGIGRRIPALKVVVLIGLILFTGYSLLDPMDRALMLIKFQNVENNEGDYLNSRRSKWEARSQEISTNIITGIGFSSQVLGDVPTDTIKSTDLQRTGEILPVRNVEPGSSWLSVISTIGIIGFLAVVWLYLSCFVSAWRHSSRLHVMLLSFFAVHLMVEGYIFGFGSCLCFILWTLLGASFRREYPGIKIHRKV